MDCIVPGHSVRTFCASMGCLSRIGKDLYLEFDPIDGLAFRTLNDAKSAYSCFRFEPSFFEKCTAPPSASSNSNTENHRRQQQQQQQQHNNSNDNTNHHKHRKRHFSSSQQTTTTSSQQEDQGGGEDSSSSSSRFSCRVALSAMAAVVKARKNVVALRIQSETANSALYLLFEFHLQPKYNNTNGNNNNNNNNNNSTGMASDHWLRVIHRVPVSGQVQGQSAMAPREGSSEIVTSNPKLLLHLLDPLKKTAEAALIVRSHALSATSFHHSDAAAAAAAAASSRTRKKSNDSRRRSSSSSRGSTQAAASTSKNNTSTTTTATANNAILQATTASLLKTETGINADEFDEFYFRDDHNEQDDEDDNDNNIGDDMPENVNSQVVLVFPIKEAKAMLQFCAAQSASIQAREWTQPLQVHVHFHWGGKPIIFGTKTDSFSAELVLATLDHKLLGPLGTNTPVETEATTTTTTEAGSTTANN